MALNLKWLKKVTIKQIIWIFSLIVLIILILPAYFEKEIEYEYNPKAIEINGSTITGYKEGKLSWLIKADYIWTGRSKYLFRGTGSSYGQLFDSNGKVIVNKLQAGKVRVNTKSKTLTAVDNIIAHFKKRKDRVTLSLKENSEEKKSTKNETIIITSDELRYYSNTKKTFFSDLYKDVAFSQSL